MDTLELLDTRSGNALVVALDHGVGMGAVAGFERPGETLASVLDGNPDGILATPAFVRQFRESITDAGVDAVLTADTLFFARGLGEYDGPIQQGPGDVQSLVELEPSGIKLMLVFGRERSALRRNLEYVRRTAQVLDGTGVPLVVETVLWGDRIPDADRTDPKRLASACRVAWEHGADALKIPYTGDVDSFEGLVDCVPIPIFVLGGPASDSPDDIVDDVRTAVVAGARGAMVGRSVWQSSDPAGVTRRLCDAVHEGV